METTKEVPELASLSDVEICAEIGRRMRAERLRRKLSQADMSELSGIPLRTYKRFEATGSGSIATLVAAVRASGRLIGLQLLLPQPTLTERKNTLGEIAKRRVSRRRTKPSEQGG